MDKPIEKYTVKVNNKTEATFSNVDAAMDCVERFTKIGVKNIRLVYSTGHEFVFSDKWG